MADDKILMDIDKAKKQLSSLMSAINDSKKQLEEIDNQVVSSKSNLKESNKELESSDGKLKDILENISENNKYTEEQKQNCIDIANDIKNNEEILSIVTNQIKKLSLELANLKLDISNLSDEQENIIKTNCIKVQKELDDLNSKKEALINGNIKLINDSKVLEDKKTSLNNEIGTLSVIQQGVKTKNESLNLEIALLEKKSLDLIDNNKKIESLLKEKESDIVLKGDELNELENKIELTNKELTKVMTQVANINSKSDELTNREIFIKEQYKKIGLTY